MGKKVLDFDRAEECVGCLACAAVCPKGAIVPKTDASDFVIPEVNENVCIGCRKCERVCQAFSRPKARRPDFVSGFVFSSSNPDTMMSSASGGAFTELALDAVDARGGACGCVWSEDFMPEHMMVWSHSDVKKFESSKYVQSSMNGVYFEVKKGLESGREIVFGGTPCQVEALDRYLARKYERLLLVSVVCRGASSPLVWDAYKRGLETRTNSRLVAINQRDKSKGYGRSMCRYAFESGAVVWRTTYVSDVYTNCFANGITLRGSCHNCPAKGYANADVILGDDVLRAGSSEGATLILCVTHKGDAWIRGTLGARGRLVELDEEQIALVPEMSNMLFGSSPPHHEARERLYRDLEAGVSADRALMRSLPMAQQIKVWLERLGLFPLARSLKARMHG